MLSGVDVSEWQEVIDWAAAAKQGIKFAVLREGYRCKEDKYFKANVEGCKANNIAIMVYHFIYIDNIDSDSPIRENARSTVKNMKARGLDIANTWIWADLEYDSWTKAGIKCTKQLCSSLILEYLDELQRLGCKRVGFYANTNYLNNYITDEVRNYPLWLVELAQDYTHGYKPVMWQHSWEGMVNGIKGNVDCDFVLDDSLLTIAEGEANKDKAVITESQMRANVANWLLDYKGISEGSTKHKTIINTFNNSGLCNRYRMTTADAWCATAVSAAFIANGYAGKAGSGSLFECIECSCYYMTEAAKAQGIWVEDDAHMPKIGDVILYDWQDSNYANTDNKGVADHVGVVLSVGDGYFDVIEGNYHDTVGIRRVYRNGAYIRGFICPNYSKFATKSEHVQSAISTDTVFTAKSREIFTVSGKYMPNKSVVWVGVTTARSGLNCRVWAGTDNPKCISLKPYAYAAKVNVCDSILDKSGNTWYYVEQGGKYGFVHSAYVK